MYPDWLAILAVVSLLIGGASALWIAFDLISGHSQKMWITNVVWPISGLYAGPLAVWAYYKMGRLSSQRAVSEAKAHDTKPHGKASRSGRW